MAYLTDTPPAGKNWLYEIKWDGVRALCFVRGGKLDYILSRTGNRCERQYPEMSVLPRQVSAHDAIIDGEIAVLDEKGRPSFNKIQPRIAQTDPNSVAHLSRSTPVTFFGFDIVYCDGYDLREAPLVNRREVLKAVFEPTDRFRVSDQFVAEGKDRTRVVLEHRKLERYGDKAEMIRAMLDGPNAWGDTLAAMAKAAEGTRLTPPTRSA